MKNLEIIIIIVLIVLFIILTINSNFIENLGYSPIFKLNKPKQDIQNEINRELQYQANVQSFNNIRQNNALNRYYNPLKYPYRSPCYLNLSLPPQVVGCGSRNIPCLYGSQVPIIATSNMLDLSNRNIALGPPMLPVNIRTQGPEDIPQQVGTIFKLRSAHSEVLPLFGRKIYPNSDKWDYYTLAGNHDVKLKVFGPRKNEQLGTNDIVFIKGYNKNPYRVTMYELDYPSYIPY